jgi:hypothetical protein
LLQRRAAEAVNFLCSPEQLLPGIGGNNRPIAAIPAKQGAGAEHYIRLSESVVTHVAI